MIRCRFLTVLFFISGYLRLYRTLHLTMSNKRMGENTLGFVDIHFFLPKERTTTYSQKPRKIGGDRFGKFWSSWVKAYYFSKGPSYHAFLTAHRVLQKISLFYTSNVKFLFLRTHFLKQSTCFYINDQTVHSAFMLCHIRVCWLFFCAPKTLASIGIAMEHALCMC
jgi:hypothetical protein